MLLPEQLHLNFALPNAGSPRESAPAINARAQEILRAVSAYRLATAVIVEWDTRLKTAAGRADYRRSRVSLNPRLRDHGTAEIDRTLRHELAHLLAQFRAGRRRIQPHGTEWRQACVDLGIAGETRCHSLPFPVRVQARLLLYRCGRCAREFPRVRLFKSKTACLACCRAHNRGRYDTRFALRLGE
ncbi:hypothetical protein BH18VER1_BH18VER1_05980 [soil metagenome]